MKKSLKEIKILSAIVQKIKFKIFKNTFLQCRRNIWSLIRMIESQKGWRRKKFTSFGDGSHEAQEGRET